MHTHAIENERGDLVDLLTFCSDSCHRAMTGAAYSGWDGCHETEHTTYCAACGVVIPGEDACACQRSNVVVNRFVSADGEKCEHGSWIQVPVSMLDRAPILLAHDVRDAYVRNETARWIAGEEQTS